MCFLLVPHNCLIRQIPLVIRCVSASFTTHENEINWLNRRSACRLHEEFTNINKFVTVYQCTANVPRVSSVVFTIVYFAVRISVRA